MASNMKSPDEKTKKEVAEQVVAKKQHYFVPGHGDIEADDMDDLQAKVKKLKEKDEDGDDDNR